MQRIKQVILIELLIIFFVVAICFTIASRYFFYHSLPTVVTTECISDKLQQNQEYFAGLTEPDMVTWSMTDTIYDVEVGDEITVKFQNITVQQNPYGKLVPAYHITDTASAVIREIELKRYEDEAGENVQEYVLRAVIEENEEKAFSEECIVSVSYESWKYDYVLPASCVKGDLGDSSDSYEIYIVREKQMPWGVMNYVVPVSVQVIARNQEYVAVRSFPGDKIIMNVQNLELGLNDWVIVVK